MGPRSVLLVLAVLSVLALCCAAPVLALEPAGDGWYWASPQPQGQFLNAVAFGDELNAWSVGDAGTIMHSSDAGVTWHRQTSPANGPLGSVVFADALQGWAAGGDGWYADRPGESSNGVILHTADGGVTWVEQRAVQGSAISDLAFAGDRQGWAVGGRGLILHTTDGGQTWVAQRSGVTRNILSVVATDALHGYAGCAEGLLLTTSDGGATWKRARRSADYAGISSLAAGADGKIWAALGRGWSGSFPRLAWTANGGRTWRYADVSRTHSIWDVVADGQHLYAVGPSDSDRDVSQALVSDDGGATWRASVTSSALLGAVAANGAGTLCAVGDITATSTDDGATWTGRSTRASILGGPDMVGPAEAWAVGDYTGWGLAGLPSLASADNALLHTTDGVRWIESFRRQGEFFSAVRFAGPTHGWAIGARGLVRHTQDGGLTWQEQASGTTADLTQLAAPSADVAWASGFELTNEAVDPAVVRTVDAGATWARVAIPDSVVPFAMTAASADHAWLVGVRLTRRGITPVALRTVDGGSTWSRVTLPFPATALALPLAVDFTDDDHGWLVALRTTDGSCVVAATSDGGATWTEVASQEDFGRALIAGVTFISATEGWVFGTGIYHTIDGGQTWVRQISGTAGEEGDDFYQVGAYDAAHALAGGYGLLSTFDVPGDSAPPVTLCAAAGGWTRTSVFPTLSAADVGTSGLAWTEYSGDGAAWTRGSTPPPFPAPADHSGDGAHLLRYRSADSAGNIEPEQVLRVRVDTVKPVIHLRRSVIGRDGVLRMSLRINDRSCASVGSFGFGIRTLRGRLVGAAGWEGGALRTNRWVILRDEAMGDFLDPGVYRIVFYAEDRAGNEQAKRGRGLLIVRQHKGRRSDGPPLSVARAGGRAVYERGALPVMAERGHTTSTSPAERLTEDLLRFARLLSQQER